MGVKQSREESAKTVGDQTVTIVENQEIHSAAHIEHAWKLNLIVALLIVQIWIALIKHAIKAVKKSLAKAATKAAIVQQV